MYSVQCTVYSVHCTLYPVQSIMYTKVVLLILWSAYLGVDGSMLEIVRPVLELVFVSWALYRDINTSFLHPDIVANQVLFISVSTLNLQMYKSTLI